MRIRYLGDREGDPAFFDMAVRFRPPGVRWYGPLRMGDRAAAHVLVGEWRKGNPGRRLVVYVDERLPGSDFGPGLPPDWLFGGMVDEIREAEVFEESLGSPVGERILTRDLWAHWAFLYRRSSFVPAIRPEKWSLGSARRILAERGVGDRFAVVHPLFDAQYDVYRNESPSWWGEFFRKLAKDTVTVVIGRRENAAAWSSSDLSGVVSLMQDDLSPMESLAVISMAGAYAGGATGMTIWAPLFGIPALALYRSWSPHSPGIDVRPRSFGGPVVRGNLGADTGETAELVLSLASGRLKESTPW